MPDTVLPNPIWAELLQLVPVIALAFPVVTTGQVDMTAMGSAFPAAAGLAVAVTIGILGAGKRLNPILVGTDLWLLAGAVGFGLGVAPLADVLGAWQGFALFAIVVPTLGLAMFHPAGAIGADGPAEWVRSRSLVVLLAGLLVAMWSGWFHADVRLGGGLPFIALNVVRRILIARGPK